MTHLAPLPHPKYRPDIDGLRAVAVLSVVGFHAFPRWVQGGFIGVDVFFVISGFLISTILFQALENGSFSFAEFYARRVKRIFPALLLVLAASFALGWFVLLPDEYRQLGKHIMAGAGFTANLVLWNESGYFDNSAETKPLLHLWSLGIEEQFYLVWPLLIWIAWKGKFNLLTITGLVAAVSFALNAKGVKTHPVATFYSPHSRIWELLCGSLLAWAGVFRKDSWTPWRLRLDAWLTRALYRVRREPDGSAIANLLSSLGVALLLYGFWRIDKTSSFPGKWAAIPVAGAVLLIAAGPKAWANRVILSNKVMVWIGLISFPLYLWHWPLLSFARIVSTDAPSGKVRVAAVAASILLAWLTYRVVERPIRGGTKGARKALVLVFSMVVVGSVGYGTFAQNGLGSRFPPIIQELTQYKYDYKRGYREGTCFLRPEQDFRQFSQCPTEAPNGRPTLLLWGDSHAAHLYPGLKTHFGDSLALVQRTASACPPILGTDPPDRPHCTEINRHVLSQLAVQRPSRVVLAAIWTDYDLSGLEATVQMLRKAGVADIDLVGPVPQWNGGLPKQLYAYFRQSLPHIVPYRMTLGLSPKSVQMDAALRGRAAALGVNYISPMQIMCDATGCLARLGETGDKLTAWDEAHLTTAGSEFLVSRFPKP
ncbi:MAG TPA: acyltransferase family protein [Ramlibacter sp.]|uniref:acyltransferase family protein n=1 Tax=Ramlibacter sp. TaxID=1917967 RepID=UPI002ED6BC52